MKSTDIPLKNPIPFANAAGSSYKRTIPTPSQTASGTDAPASFTDGFPPLTFQPKTAGGIPPNGADINGILAFVTAWTRWQQLGGPINFDSGFSSALPTAGYPAGARIASASRPGLTWVNTVDGNTTDPDSGSAANWIWEGDLGHSYNPNGGYFTIGPIIVNMGTVQIPSGNTTGVVTVTFAKPLTSSLLIPGAFNTGSGNPSSTSNTGNYTLSNMTVGMSSAPSTGGGAFTPALPGTTSSWFAIGI